MTAAARPTLTGPILLASIVQLLALAIAALRVPLSDGYAEPAEDLAAGVMVTVQMVMIAAVFPFLLQGMRRTLVMLGLPWPYLLLAGFLATTPWRSLLWAEVLVNGWTVTLAVWRGILPRPRQQAVAVAAALLLTLGAAALRYLAAEYQPQVTSGASSGVWLAFSPLLGNLEQLRQDGPHLPPFLAIVALLLMAGLVRLGQAVRTRR